MHICSTSEIQIWDVSKNFQLPTFQQCKGMPDDCFVTQLLCNLYGESFTFLTLQWFHLSLYPSQLPVGVGKYGSIAPLLKKCSPYNSHVRHRNHVATECARAVYCFRKTNNIQKATTPKQEMSFLLNQCPTQIHNL